MVSVSSVVIVDDDAYVFDCYLLTADVFRRDLTVEST